MVATQLRSSRHALSEAEEKFAARMLLDGCSMTEVAQMLGRSLPTITAWMNRLRQSAGWMKTDKEILLRVLGLNSDEDEAERMVDFNPMLRVDIRTGIVMLDRVREVLGYGDSKRQD